MTRKAWIEHLEHATGLKFEKGNPDNYEVFLDTIAYHKRIGCEVCADRQRTYKASKARSMREAAYRSAGLVKVKGAITGQTYWE